MRHRSRKITLSRTSGERRALERKLGMSFVTHGRITTTPARARFLRRFIEPLVTTAKRQDLVARRRIAAALGNRAGAAVLLKRAEAYRDRPGGYTRVTKIASVRSGDNAAQVMIEFV